MTPEQLLRIETLYHAAREKAPDRREAFLRDACGGDTDLSRRVASLLAQDEPDGPMDRPLLGIAAELLDIPAAPRWEAGAMVGPYRVERLLGEGGMGEVYRARDTRLGRNVAIKTAKQEFSGRFKREAKAISALNHPNICTLYDVGPDFLVMEYIEGAEIKGPLPINNVLHLATQIAEALNHAHRHGVIHRDLKPSNILVTKAGVKVLDFGLAKLSSPDTADGEWDASLASGITVPGMIAGTPRYLAPEQLEGRAADGRSDIFAFGVVLYEIITGQPAFEGKSPGSLMAAILTAEPPPISRFQPQVPPALVHLVETCLAKDPDDRKQNMHDILLELRWIAGTVTRSGVTEPAAAGSNRQQRLRWGIAAASAALLTLGLFYIRQAPEPVHPVRFQKPLPPGNILRYWDTPAVAPDGRSFAYTGIKLSAEPVLWVQRLDAMPATPLPGTEGARLPFWSPDSRFIAYFAAGKLWKVAASGGLPQILCDWPDHFGGTWSRNGLIIVAKLEGPLHQVSASGGQPKPLLALDTARQETRQTWPHFLPDGKHFFYASVTATPGTSGVYLGSIDAQPPRRLIDTVSNASFVLPDLLLFGRGRRLMAQPFDRDKLQITGEPFPAMDVVGLAEVARNSIYSSSPNGVLVYRSEISAAAALQLVWFDRNGKRHGTLGQPRAYRQGVLAPDEKRFAVEIIDPTSAIPDIWLLDLASGVLSRLTSDTASKNTVVWSPDGREILFSSNKTGTLNLYRKGIEEEEEHLVHASAEPIYPADWLKDGSIAFQNTNGRTFFRILPGADANPVEMLKTHYSKHQLRVSPDGRWVAYNSDETGQWEVYIAAFPSFSGKRRISDKGGAQGYWRKDGKELFYLSLDGNMVSVPIRPGLSPEFGQPKVLFPTRVPVNAAWDQFAVTGDGQRFLALEPVNSEVTPFTVVLNWPSALQR